MPRGDSVQRSLPEKVIAIDRALREAKIPHAIGGALALAYYAEPRATIDIDLNLFVSTDRWDDVASALGQLGVDTSGADLRALARDGQCRLWWGENAVDLFFAYDEIHAAMRRETRRVPFADVEIPILSPEHLAVCKALFDRPKDWIDIAQMLIAADGIDPAEIESWLVQMVGEGDLRLRRFRDLRTEVEGA